MTLIMGAHTVEELFRFQPKKIIRVFTSKKSPLTDEMEKQRIPITVVSREALTKMVDSDSHQSIVAEIRPRDYLEPDAFLSQAGDESFVLMLDQIFDPQNFGALLRSAECFGLSAVIWSKNRGCDLTPVAAKASCGASELVPLIRVSNLATTLDLFKKEGFEIVATVLEEGAESAYGFSYAPRTLLILSSEGEGIQPLLRKKADRAIYLPMQGKIQSLNVAQAASALLALKQVT